MLIDMENGGEWLRTVPLPELYREMLGHLTPDELGRLRRHVDGRFDAMLGQTDGQVTTGVGTDEERLGDGFKAVRRALDGSDEQIARFENLLYCAVAIERPENWGCYHDEEDTAELPDQTYYLIR